jgi:hypothetical protein
MRLELKEGEAITVTFSNCDGEITVAWIPPGGVPYLEGYGGCTPQVCLIDPTQPRGGLIVHTDLPDAQGRVGIIYNEVFDDNGDRPAPVAPPVPLGPMSGDELARRYKHILDALVSDEPDDAYGNDDEVLHWRHRVAVHVLKLHATKLPDEHTTPGDENT